MALTKEYLAQLEQAKRASIPIVYLDETGFQTSVERQYGWSFPGERIQDYRCGQKRKMCNLIGGYMNNKLVASYLFQESCNATLFNNWLSDYLLPLLFPGTIIVLDNARFHKTIKTEELVKKSGCRLLFLPPYSPHLNPIEKLWGNMKIFRRNHADIALTDLIKSYH